MATGFVGTVALAGIAVSVLEHTGVAVSPLQDSEPVSGYIVDAAHCHGKESAAVRMPGLVAADTAAASHNAVVAENISSVTAGAESPGFCKDGGLDLLVQSENMGEVAEGIAQLLNLHCIAMSDGMSSTAMAGCTLVAILPSHVGRLEI